MKFLAALSGLFFALVACSDTERAAPPPPPAPEESPARVEAADSAPTVSARDFEPILGDGWEGKLVYADPSEESGQRSTEAGLSVSSDGSTLTLDFSFPGAPQGDGSAALEISGDGGWINDERVVQREEEEDGVLTILTRQECFEGRYIATCEYLYDISESRFSIAKAVTLAGEDEKRFGHQYTFTRGE